MLIENPDGNGKEWLINTQFDEILCTAQLQKVKSHKKVTVPIDSGGNIRQNCSTKLSNSHL